MNALHGTRAAALAAALSLTAACGSTATPGEGPGAELVVSAAVASLEVNLLRIRVTGPDMSPLLYNLLVEDGYASATLKVPAGPTRTFEATAFALTGDVTHEGSIVIDVRQGSNPPARIPLVPKAGRVPIEVQLAELGVQGSPPTASAPVLGTVQLTATVRIVGGQVVSVPVDWASDNPAIAWVSPAGLVTCSLDGEVEIQAVAEGIPGRAFITCGTQPVPAIASPGRLP
jgi:hypothetical protein